MGEGDEESRCAGRLTRADLLAFIAMAGLCLGTTVWKSVVGLKLVPDITLLLFDAGSLIALGAYYARYRAREWRLGDVCLYAGIWITWGPFAVMLTYLIAAWNFPLQDQLFSALDRGIGFDWAKLVVLNNDTTGLLAFERLAYGTYYPQAFLCVVFVALWEKPGANGRLLLAIIFTFCITTLISGFLPSLGPAELNHFTTPWGPVVPAIRQGSQGPFPYVGIVNFPSFHAAMAVLYTIVHQESRIRMYSFGALNILMTLSIPFAGGHYLLDVPAGIALALFGWWMAGRLITRPVLLKPRSALA
jgi:hypothetical protein